MYFLASVYLDDCCCQCVYDLSYSDGSINGVRCKSASWNAVPGANYVSSIVQ